MKRFSALLIAVIMLIGASADAQTMQSVCHKVKDPAKLGPVDINGVPTGGKELQIELNYPVDGGPYSGMFLTCTVKKAKFKRICTPIVLDDIGGSAIVGVIEGASPANPPYLGSAPQQEELLCFKITKCYQTSTGNRVKPAPLTYRDKYSERVISGFKQDLVCIPACNVSAGNCP